ncbi:MAG: hypothetical protein LBC59_03145 [Chitinispirillales bacterium]|jgi:hypothetical protein|nr:hypothetical protein [Chitinispirillales bacterium]
METQTIREVKRIERTEPTVFDRLRGRRRVDPLRETAEGLGVVLDKLSESVTDVLPRQSDGFGDGGSDGVEIEGGRRTRGFKLRQYDESAPTASEDAPVQEDEAAAESAAAAAVAAAQEVGSGQAEAGEEAEVLDILKRARDVAADAVAPPVVMPAHDRAVAQAKLKELFLELGMKRIEIISSIFSHPEQASSVADFFSLATPESAKAAYDGIDWMIMKYLNAGRDTETGAAGGAGSVYEGHEAAINATEQLKAFLQKESPEKAFMRFREVNRSNILGLLQ